MQHAKSIKTDYENFYAECPHCDQLIAFNRRDDLKTFDLISYREVACLNHECQKPFSISNDCVNIPAEMIMQEAEEYLNNKKYMLSVILSVQALESFFGLLFIVELGYKNFIPSVKDLDKLNEFTKIYKEKTTRFTYPKFVNAILNYLVNYERPENLDAAIIYANDIKNTTEKPDFDKLALVPEEFKEVWEILHNSDSHILRNSIAHKNAYRPSKTEAELTMNEAYSIIYKLMSLLKIGGNDLNYYFSNRL